MIGDGLGGHTKIQPCQLDPGFSLCPLCLKSRNTLAKVVKPNQSGDPTADRLLRKAKASCRPSECCFGFTLKQRLGNSGGIEHVRKQTMPREIAAFCLKGTDRESRDEYVAANGSPGRRFTRPLGKGSRTAHKSRFVSLRTPP